MANEESKNEDQQGSNKNASVKADPETLNTTDPQEHMKGPVSSLMNGAGESFESDESQKEADKKESNK